MAHEPYVTTFHHIGLDLSKLIGRKMVLQMYQLQTGVMEDWTLPPYSSLYSEMRVSLKPFPSLC